MFTGVVTAATKWFDDVISTVMDEDISEVVAVVLAVLAVIGVAVATEHGGAGIDAMAAGVGVGVGGALAVAGITVGARAVTRGAE